MSEVDEVREPKERGEVVWHSTEEDGGPDVGLDLALGGGVTLWFGEVSRQMWNAAGLPNEEFKSDGGWWIVLYAKGEGRLLAKCIDDFEARDAVDVIAAALRAEPAAMVDQQTNALMIAKRRAVASIFETFRHHSSPTTDRSDSHGARGQSGMIVWESSHPYIRAEVERIVGAESLPAPSDPTPRQAAEAMRERAAKTFEEETDHYQEGMSAVDTRFSLTRTLKWPRGRAIAAAIRALPIDDAAVDHAQR